MTETKKILLIGRSGRGKSTLANVITGMENKFKESALGASETKKIQFEEFKDNNINYLIIDTPGIGDTKMSDNEVLDIIADAVYLAKDGLSQVLFVVGGRFDQYEMATYNLLRTIIFDEHIAKHTTIVRTRFQNFRKPKKCQADIDLMVKEAKDKKNELEKDISKKEKELKNLSADGLEYQNLSKEIEKTRKELIATNLAEIISSCQEKVIYVDNPSLSIAVADNEDEEKKAEREEELKSNQNKREKSRKILLSHLEKICQNSPYQPDKLKELSKAITEDMDKLLQSKKELEAELKRLKPKKNQPSTNKINDRNNKSKQEKISEEDTKSESIVEKNEESVTENSQEITAENNDSFGIGERITQLESKKSRLKREIEEKEQIIRKKVLKHIFNNYDGVSNELGGNVFLDSVTDDKNDWKTINESFTDKKLILEWKSNGFDYQQVQKWAIVLGDSLNPERDAGFCAWLRDDKHLTVEKIKNLSHIFNIEQLRDEYADQLEKETELLVRYSQQISQTVSIIIKLQNNINLYSGDVITINGSSPLLVEVISDQTIKLRNIKNDKYLSKKYPLIMGALDFLVDFENALIFTVKGNENGEISLRTDDNRYLKPKGEEFALSSKERWLNISKQQNTENIADFEETMEIVKVHEEKRGNVEKLLIAQDFYDNKSENPLQISNKLTKSIQKEHNFTWSTDFTWGVSANLSLVCFSIAGVEISGQFEKNTSTSNAITKTKSETIEKGFDATCSPWKKMRVKLEVEKTRLLTPYTASVKRIIGRNNYQYSIDGEYSCDNFSEPHVSSEEITVRNILLVGCTGSGKSTLAKVLSGDNKFEEGSGSVSKTKFFKKSKEFKWKENDYCVIDNIGFGDTKISEREELIRIGEAINSTYQGLSHVLFVFSGRFSDKEKEGFRKLAALKITNDYITLVRSKFDNFYNEDECKEDEESLRKESPEISRLFDNCRGILHVDNGDEDSRDESREIALNYLSNNCADDPFKPNEWENISSLIDSYLEKKTKLENEKKQADTAQKEAIDQQIDILKTNTATQVKEKIQGEEISEFIKIVKKESEELQSQQNSQIQWDQIIQTKANIPGTIKQIIPLETNQNQVLVINKLILYGIRLFEYNSQEDELTELKRYAKNKLGYPTLEDALAKTERIKEDEKTISQWKNIHSEFTREAIQKWQENNFTFEQCRKWLDIGLKSTDAEFCSWLRDVLKITPEQVLNKSSNTELRELFQEYKSQRQQQSQIQIPPKYYKMQN